ADQHLTRNAFRGDHSLRGFEGPAVEPNSRRQQDFDPADLGKSEPSEENELSQSYSSSSSSLSLIDYLAAVKSGRSQNSSYYAHHSHSQLSVDEVVPSVIVAGQPGLQAQSFSGQSNSITKPSPIAPYSKAPPTVNRKRKKR